MLIRFIVRSWWVFLAVGAAAWALLFAAGLFAEVPLPKFAPGSQSTKVFDSSGHVIGSFHGEENRTIVDLGSVSHHLKDAVVAAEDRNFYTHPGVSLRGILRAAVTNFREGEIGQGASTITQQYARIVSGIGRERSYARKLKEATLAVKMERDYSKQKILEFYLNTVYFGRGAYGAEAAAQTYFKKPAGQLELAEAAYLAGVIRSPSRYQQENNPRGVEQIKDRVLRSMLSAGFIDRNKYAEAEQVDLSARFKFGLSAELDSPKAGYFIEYVRQLLLSEFKIPEIELLGGGLEIYTTLDMAMQEAAEEAVRSTMNQPTDPEVALIAMDPQGQVRAMVGGRVVDDPQRARGFNFAANLPGADGGRQAGSAFKPFALAAFVDEGKSIYSKFAAPPQIQIDSKTCRNADGTPWKVSNFDDAGYENLDLIEGTTRSVNTVFAQVMDRVVSPSKFMSMASKAGIDIPRGDEGCALALGTTDVTPLEMARAYATFAARGRRPEPLVIEKIVSADGATLHERHPRSEQTMDQNVADTVSWILKQNIQRGTGTGAKLPWPAMGKTGTAQNHADASFAGSTPELTAVVWLGYPPSGDPPQIPLMTSVHGDRVTGGSLPATIWRKFMSEALKGAKHSDFPTPDRLDGEVLAPSPIPCPAPGSSPTPGGSPATSTAPVNCAPQPSPSGFFELPTPAAPAVDETPPPATSPSPTPPPCLLGILCPAKN